jgi:hypothetical protein
MAPPGVQPMLKLALFNMTPKPIPQEFLSYIQLEADRQNDEKTCIEVIPTPSGPKLTLLEMARYSKDHFLAVESPFGSRSFLAADETSIQTRSVIITSLTNDFILPEQRGPNDKEPEEEDDIIEGHMRMYPKSCIQMATTFDGGLQGVDTYEGIALHSPNKILPREETPPPGPVGPTKVRQFGPRSN